jgi:DMSO/TMAO reductase YedYZ heme-binding membrane subunit
MVPLDVVKIDLKKWLWIITIPTLLILLALGIFQAGEPAGFSAITGTVLLAFTLLPSMLMRLGFLKENSYLRWLVKYRKDLGIISGTWLLSHGLISALFFFKRDESILDQLLAPPLQPVWIMIPILALMLITSNKASERKLGRQWKNLHSLVWILPGLMFYHGNLAIANFEKEDFAPAAIILAVIAVVAIYEFFKTRSYKRVLLILIGFIFTMAFWSINTPA